MADIASSFHQTAKAPDPALVRCLDFMNGLPFFETYKAHSWDALRIKNDARILDVACGVGFDVIGMARRFPNARFWGLDVSEAFLEIAQERAAGLPNVAFLKGEAVSIPFADNHFDGLRIDRSLQHIKNPLAVIEEMARVTRPGGRIVATEPDWGTYVVNNGRLDACRAITETWLKSFINPLIGREIGLLLARAGVDVTDCSTHALTVREFASSDIIFDLRRTVDNCVEMGVFSADEGIKWTEASEKSSENGAFFACLSIVEWTGLVRKMDA